MSKYYYHSTLPRRQLRPKVRGWPAKERQMKEHCANFLTPSIVSASFISQCYSSINKLKSLPLLLMHTRELNLKKSKWKLNQVVVPWIQTGLSFAEQRNTGRWTTPYSVNRVPLRHPWELSTEYPADAMWEVNDYPKQIKSIARWQLC